MMDRLHSNTLIGTALALSMVPMIAALKQARVDDSIGSRPAVDHSPQQQRIYHAAFESVVWALPMLNTLQMRAELKRHGVPNGTLAMISQPPTGRLEAPTFNNTTCYIFGSVSLADGPWVLDVPPATDRAKLFGSIYNVWDSPLEDIGPAGIDKGDGGQFLLLPPNWNGDVPQGMREVRSTSFDVHFLLRSVPASEGEQAWIDAAEYARHTTLFALGSNPPASGRFFDATGIDGYFHGNPYPGFELFEYMNEYVQEEPVQQADLVAHGMLKSIGIEKGKPFAPDAATRAVLEAAAQDAFSYMRGYLESGKAFEPFWEDRTWGNFRFTPEVIKSGASYNLADRQDYHTRALDMFYWAVGMPKRFDVGGGGATHYVMTATDSDGRSLDGGAEYRLHLPANVPARDFWSVILYSTRTRSFLDTSRFGLSSKDAPKSNDDGSFDLYVGPTCPPGKESNWLETLPGEGLFMCIRFYGPTDALVEKRWKPDDPERLR